MHYYQKLPDVFIYGKNIFFFSDFHDIQLYFFTIWPTAERQEETGRDLIGWLHVIDRQVHLITFPVRLPLLTTLTRM